MPTAHHRKDCPTCQSPGAPLNGCQHLWHIEVRLAAPTGPEPEERVGAVGRIYGYAARLDAEADRVQAIQKTRQHGKTYNANVAVGLIAAARFLREWADEDAPWPDDDLAAQVSALQADVARLGRERDLHEGCVESWETTADGWRSRASRAEAERDEARADVARLEGERKEARHATRRLTAALIAVSPLLETPYTDAPEWTPWARFVAPALKRLRASMGMTGDADA